MAKPIKNTVEIKDATHKLSCSHAFNEKSRYDYWMDCIVLKRMPNNRLKILIFGERYWKYHDDKKQIRYVDEDRVKPNSNFRSVVNE